VAENRDGIHVRIVAFLVFLMPAAAWAADVNVIGLFPNKAVVQIDGGEPRVMTVGQPPVNGVSLVASDRENATFLIDGQKKTLKIGQHHAAPTKAPSAQTATLTANAQGHFLVDGQVNGGPVRFLVDTGATQVSLSGADATRLGIDYRKGQPGLVGTANGTAIAYKVTVDTVRVGDIVLNNVDTVVLEGGLPYALLGMSFLNRMEMKREGQVMILTRRF